MEFAPPPPRLLTGRRDGPISTSTTPAQGWERVEVLGDRIPCQRSLHAGAVWKDNFIVFGGYDGQNRINDLYSFDFKSSQWNLLNNNNAPTPRDRHVAVVHDNSLYVFGGFDGTMRVNDLYAYNLERNEWRPVDVVAGAAPSPRHSHAAVVYQDSMFVFGGYDGSYRSDLHEFNFTTRRWMLVPCTGETPRARYRGTCVVSDHVMILHGGHDGNRHLQDTHVFDFVTLTWSTLVTEGSIPSPRDSHISVIYGKSMFLYGGSTGSAMGDFHELKLEFRRVWSPVPAGSNNVGGSYIYGPSGPSGSGWTGSGRVTTARSPGASGNFSTGGSGSATGTPSQRRTVSEFQSTAGPNGVGAGYDGEVVSPGVRFCHVGVVYDGALYIFGGYDGTQRLNDFLRFRFGQNESEITPPPSSLVTDLKSYVNNEVLSDVQFIVEGIPVHAHKILCLRCPFFNNLLMGEYMESRAREVVINDVKYSTFLLLLQYIYCDQVDITIDTAMDLFQAADRFGLDRLKRLCELEMLNAISVDTAAHILFTADQHNAENLRERCMTFVLQRFDEISRTPGFEEMGRTNVELVFEILRRR